MPIVNKELHILSETKNKMSTIETKSIVWNVHSLKWEPIKSKTFCTWPHKGGFCLGVTTNDEWRCRYHQDMILNEQDNNLDLELLTRKSWYWEGEEDLTIDLATREVYKGSNRMGRLNVYDQQWWLD